MRLLDALMGRDQNTNWKRIPEHATNEAVLILAKAMLMDTDAIVDGASGYPEDSAVSKATREYSNTITFTLGCILEDCKTLLDTPLGDHTMLDALALARAQVDEGMQPVKNNKK